MFIYIAYLSGRPSEGVLNDRCSLAANDNRETRNRLVTVYSLQLYRSVNYARFAQHRNFQPLIETLRLRRVTHVNKYFSLDFCASNRKTIRLFKPHSRYRHYGEPLRSSFPFGIELNLYHFLAKQIRVSL